MMQKHRKKPHRTSRQSGKGRLSSGSSGLGHQTECLLVEKVIVVEGVSGGKRTVEAVEGGRRRSVKTTKGIMPSCLLV